MNFQAAVTHTEQDIEKLTESPNLFPIVSKVIDSFDGKVYNKRFDAAIREANSKIYVTHGYDKKYISIEYGPYNTAVVFCHIRKVDLKDGKRIDAKQWNRQLKERLIAHFNEKQALIIALANISDILNQAEELRVKRNNIVSRLPGNMRSYFNLDYNYR